MRPDDIPLLAMLRDTMGYHGARQRVIAENVANANTPGYTPNDIPRSEFERVLAGQQAQGATGLRTTHAQHYGGDQGGGGSAQFKTERAPDSETTANGNSVVIEEQMVDANENRMRFETALSLYQKSLNMIRMASRSPGQ
ncbi:flagellar basal body protein [Oceanicaulis sp. MMSF_3324]|uniref:flagellar basal body protein n=1 Tax=Oceanicaulis sp. MMSF_3324 TaxID=3046702 RepID=UPI00273FD379|nr:flagellar basal body protein [Oceanicaulis sp. MMSF_3324]